MAETRLAVDSHRAAGLAILSVMVLLGCADAPPGLTNLVVVTLDTTRADHLGLYGYPRDTSPELDAFASQAIVFERALAPMATTLPTHFSLFTATHPLEHGVLANRHDDGSRFQVATSLQLFAEVARKAGYRTAAFVSAAPLRRGSDIERGFEIFTEPAEKRIYRPGHHATTEALAWLADISHPFLLWVHYFDAHWPFAPPPETAELFQTDAMLETWIAERKIPDQSVRIGVGPEESRSVLNRYDAELRYQDRQLGLLLEALQARPDWQQTAVLILGDHGEGLSQHGHSAHGGTWDEQLHVPLLMRVPGLEPRREEALLSVIDVLPTFLGLLQAPELEAILAQSSGRDRLSDTSEAQVLSQDSGRFRKDGGYRYALTTPNWKYIRRETDTDTSQELLFELASDPFELEDVAAARPGVVAELRERMAAELGQRLESGLALRPEELPDAPPDPGLLEQLRQLGYVGPGESVPGASLAPPEATAP